MPNMLTSKECAIIEEILALEENACKKARLYSRVLTDKELSEKLYKIADGHEKRFKALISML